MLKSAEGYFGTVTLTCLHSNTLAVVSKGRGGGGGEGLAFQMEIPLA